MSYVAPSPVAGRGITVWTSGDTYGVGAFCLATIGLDNGASGVWPAANRALLFPFGVPSVMTAYKIIVGNGSAVSGNVDVGIYDAAGTLLVSSGSTAQAGTTAYQEFDITNTVLYPGRLYYVALALDNIVGAVRRVQYGARNIEHLGVREKASAFPLPNPLTGTSGISSSYYPMIGIEMVAR